MKYFEENDKIVEITTRGTRRSICDAFKLLCNVPDEDDIKWDFRDHGFAVAIEDLKRAIEIMKPAGAELTIMINLTRNGTEPYKSDFEVAHNIAMIHDIPHSIYEDSGNIYMSCNEYRYITTMIDELAEKGLTVELMD